jgi:hypothetical protein
MQRVTGEPTMKKFVLLLILISLTAVAVFPASAQRICRDLYGRTIVCPTNTTTSFINPGAIQGFDPQPEPPTLGEIRGFDPQPDPPLEVNNLPGTGYDAVGFNPQPDPPHQAVVGRFGLKQFSID